MNVMLLRTLVALAPACVLFVGSLVLFVRQRGLFSLLQVVGAGCLVVVVLTHVCEALNMFPRMLWGRENSVGHYIDLLSAGVGLTLFPIGYLLSALAGRAGSQQMAESQRT